MNSSVEEAYLQSRNRLLSHLKLRGVRITSAVAAYSRFIAHEALYSLYLDESCLMRRKYLSKLSGTTIRRLRELFEGLGLIKVIAVGEFRNKAATRIEIDTDLRHVLGIELAVANYANTAMRMRRLRAVYGKKPQDSESKAG